MKGESAWQTIEMWVVTDRWFTTHPIVRGYCACGYSTTARPSVRLAWETLGKHQEADHDGQGVGPPRGDVGQVLGS